MLTRATKGWSAALMVSASALSAWGCSGDAVSAQDMGWSIEDPCQGRRPCLDMEPDAAIIPQEDAAPDQAPAPLEGMVIIPEGPFIRGTSNEVNSSAAFFGEAPVRKIELSRYAIDVHEVRVRDYARCVEQGACTPPKTPSREPELCNWGVAERAEHPINCVDWFQADAYCRWAGKLLPTEAQWEKAARGPDGLIYPWGDAPQPSCEHAVIAFNYTRRGCATGYTWPVGSKPQGASPYGVMDMLGNVQEWNSDLFNRSYYSTAPDKDPRGPDENFSTYRSLRGGTLVHGEGTEIYASMRSEAAPDDAGFETGFRCAKDL